MWDFRMPVIETYLTPIRNSWPKVGAMKQKHQIGESGTLRLSFSAICFVSVDAFLLPRFVQLGYYLALTLTHVHTQTHTSSDFPVNGQCE